MNQYIAILRGINVGGKRKILMNDLKELFLELGFSNIKTYIQSGNVIFEASDTDTEKMSELIQNSIMDKYQFEVPVIVFQHELIEYVTNHNPFLESAELADLHVTFLKSEPNKELVNQLKIYEESSDQYVVDQQVVFLHCSGKYHKSKYSNAFFEKGLQVTATTRNWKTVMKLKELSDHKK